MEETKILIVEDEAKIARFTQLELAHEGYEVFVAENGRKALELFEEVSPDVIILDLMLPEINGTEVCRRIRKNSEVPIIMLTAKGEVMDKVMGLDSGANDYMTKPFAIEELLARIRAVLRNKNYEVKNRDKSSLKLNDISIDESKRVVKYKEEEIELTKKEFDLLLYFIKNKNIVLTRDNILNNVWGYDYIGETNIVDVYIRYLRTKIDDKYGIKVIYTRRGVGYIAKD